MSKTITSLLFLLLATFIVSGCTKGAIPGAPSGSLSPASDASNEDQKQVPQDKVLSTAHSLYRSSLRKGMQPDEARQATIDWLRSQSAVEEAGISDGATIWMILRSGRTEAIITDSWIGR